MDGEAEGKRGACAPSRRAVSLSLLSTRVKGDFVRGFDREVAQRAREDSGDSGGDVDAAELLSTVRYGAAQGLASRLEGSDVLALAGDDAMKAAGMLEGAVTCIPSGATWDRAEVLQVTRHVLRLALEVGSAKCFFFKSDSDSNLKLKDGGGSEGCSGEREAKHDEDMPLVRRTRLYGSHLRQYFQRLGRGNFLHDVLTILQDGNTSRDGEGEGEGEGEDNDEGELPDVETLHLHYEVALGIFAASTTFPQAARVLQRLTPLLGGEWTVRHATRCVRSNQRPAVVLASLRAAANAAHASPRLAVSALLALAASHYVEPADVHAIDALLRIAANADVRDGALERMLTQLPASERHLLRESFKSASVRMQLPVHASSGTCQRLAALVQCEDQLESIELSFAV